MELHQVKMLLQISFHTLKQAKMIKNQISFFGEIFRKIFA